MELPKDLVEIHKKFKENNRVLYIVGGAVRDHIRDETPYDFDLVTNALPDEIMNILCEYKTDLQGQQFGVIRVFTEKNEYEIATYRKDVSKARDNKSSGKKVEIGNNISVRDDVLRRDFTQNALIYDIPTGLVYDHVGGIDDIRNRVIRTVGNSNDRFEEDRLRMLRALRLAIKTESKISEDVHNALLKKNLKIHSTEDDISQERIIEELSKTFKFCQKRVSLSKWKRYLKLLRTYNILEEMFPGIKLNRNFRKIKFLSLPITFAEIFKKNKEPQFLLKKMIEDFKFDSNFSSSVIFLNKFRNYKKHDIFELIKEKRKIGISKKLIINFGIDVAKMNKMFVRTFANYVPQINGNELIKKEGFQQGKLLGDEIKRREKEYFFNKIKNHKNKKL